jgi:hypothetical protein
MYLKYLKYKSKYLALKQIYNQSGGTNFKFTMKIDKSVKEVFDTDINLKSIFTSTDKFYEISNESDVANTIFDLYKAHFLWNITENSKKIDRSIFAEYKQFKPNAIYILNTTDFSPFIKKWCGDISQESAQQIISKIISASDIAFSDPDDQPDNFIEWLDETIVYLIRDIRTQQFGRDRRAMELRNGEDWMNWTTRGIISSKLLSFLWIDRRNLFDYNIEIMSYLELCAKIPDIKNDSFFLIVPLQITNLGHDPKYYELLRHCCSEPRFDKETQDDCLISYDLDFTKPLAFIFDTLVTHLISRFSAEYTELQPKLTVSQATLLIEGSKVILFVNWEKQIIQCVISTYAKHQTIYNIIESELKQILATRVDPGTFEYSSSSLCELCLNPDMKDGLDCRIFKKIKNIINEINEYDVFTPKTDHTESVVLRAGTRMPIDIDMNIEDYYHAINLARFPRQIRENIISGVAIDAGGLKKTFFTRLCNEFCAKYLEIMDDNSYIFKKLDIVKDNKELIYYGFMISRMILLGLWIPFRFHKSVAWQINHQDDVNDYHILSSIRDIKQKIEDYKETYALYESSGRNVESLRIKISDLSVMLDEFEELKLDKAISESREENLNAIYKAVNISREKPKSLGSDTMDTSETSEEFATFEELIDSSAESLFIQGLNTYPEIQKEFNELKTNINIYYKCDDDYYEKIIKNLREPRLIDFFQENRTNIDLLKSFYKLATGLECANYDLRYVYDQYRRSEALFNFHTCFDRVDINMLTMNDIKNEDLLEKITYQILPDSVDTYNSN